MCIHYIVLLIDIYILYGGKCEVFLRKVLMQMGNDQPAERLYKLGGPFIVFIDNCSRYPYKRAAGRLPEKRFHSNEPLLHPIIRGKRIANLEPIGKDLRHPPPLYG